MTQFVYPGNDDIKFERWFSMLLESTMSDKRQTVATILDTMLTLAKEKFASVLLKRRTAAFKKCSLEFHLSASNLLNECPELQMALNMHLEPDNQIEIPTELTNEWLALKEKLDPDALVPRTTWSSSSLATSDSYRRKRVQKRLKIRARKFRARKHTDAVNAVKKQLMFPSISLISGSALKRKTSIEEFSGEPSPKKIHSSKSQIENPTEPLFKKFKFCDLLACFITMKAEIRCIKKGFRSLIGQWRLQDYKPVQVYHDCTPPRSSCRSPFCITFNHIELIGYMQKINNYFEKQPDTYQTFINILNNYGLQYYNPRPEHSMRGPPTSKVHICQQIAEVIPDENLLQEFIQFLPFLGYLCRNATKMELLNR